jgi:hypothetical protein
MPLLAQDPVEGLNVFGDLSEEQTRPIFESRQLAYQELARQSATFASPDIAIALEFPSYLISNARVTAVQLSNGSTVSRTKISFHVEQMLRGESKVTDFDVESRWVPSLTLGDAENPVDNGFPHRTVLDLSEPKKGDRYILGYSLGYSDGRTVYVPSAINTQDPSQAQLIRDMENFFSIESAAAKSGFEPYLTALDSLIPWVREIAVHRLTSSHACNASHVCIETFLALVRQKLKSNIPNDRLEASDWIVWIDSVSRSEGPQEKQSDGMPILPDSVIRRLLSSAIDDPNIYIGDQAFERREMFDFQRTGKSGECIQIVPALRKSAHWRAGEHDYSGKHELLPVGFALTSTTSCIAPSPSRSIH